MQVATSSLALAGARFISRHDFAALVVAFSLLLTSCVLVANTPFYLDTGIDAMYARHTSISDRSNALRMLFSGRSKYGRARSLPSHAPVPQQLLDNFRANASGLLPALSNADASRDSGLGSANGGRSELHVLFKARGSDGSNVFSRRHVPRMCATVRAVQTDWENHEVCMLGAIARSPRTALSADDHAADAPRCLEPISVFTFRASAQRVMPEVGNMFDKLTDVVQKGQHKMILSTMQSMCSRDADSFTKAARDGLLCKGVHNFSPCERESCDSSGVCETAGIDICDVFNHMAPTNEEVETIASLPAGPLDVRGCGENEFDWAGLDTTLRSLAILARWSEAHPALAYISLGSQAFTDIWFREDHLATNVTRFVFPARGDVGDEIGARARAQDAVFAVSGQLARASTRELEVTWRQWDYYDVYAQRALLRSVAWSFASLLFLLVFAWSQWGSIVLTIAIVATILAMFPLALFIYAWFLGYDWIGVLQLLGIFIILGIGADDAFVIIEHWKHSEVNVPSMGLPLRSPQYVEARLAWTLEHSFTAVTATSLTTIAAFAANMISPITPVRLFGLFMAILSTLNYVTLLFVVPALLALRERLNASERWQLFCGDASRELEHDDEEALQKDATTGAATGASLSAASFGPTHRRSRSQYSDITGLSSFGGSRAPTFSPFAVAASRVTDPYSPSHQGGSSMHSHPVPKPPTFRHVNAHSYQHQQQPDPSAGAGNARSTGIRSEGPTMFEALARSIQSRATSMPGYAFLGVEQDLRIGDKRSSISAEGHAPEIENSSGSRAPPGPGAAMKPGYGPAARNSGGSGMDPTSSSTTPRILGSHAASSRRDRDPSLVHSVSFARGDHGFHSEQGGRLTTAVSNIDSLLGNDSELAAHSSMAGLRYEAVYGGACSVDRISAYGRACHMGVCATAKHGVVHVFFEATLSRFVSRHAWSILSITVVLLAISGWLASGLTLPQGRPSVWRPTHNMHRYFDMEDMFAFGRRMSRISISAVFGLRAQDHGSLNSAYEWGELTLAPGMDLTDPAAQQWQYDFCKALRKRPGDVAQESVVCPMELLNEYLQEANVGKGLPIPRQEFLQYVQLMSHVPSFTNNFFFAEPELHEGPPLFNSHTMVLHPLLDPETYNHSNPIPPLTHWDVRSGAGKGRRLPHAEPSLNFTDLAVAIISYDLKAVATAPFVTLKDVYDREERWMQQLLNKAPPSLSSGFQTASGWQLFEMESVMYMSGKQSLLLSLILAFSTLLVVTGNVIMALYSTACIGGIILVFLASMRLQGWTLGVIECVCVTVLVGLAVDYIVHIATAYCHAPFPDRHKRIAFALGTVGLSVASGAITTIGAAMFLFPCEMAVFFQFGMFVTVTLLSSIVAALLVLPALCAIGGPQGYTGDVKALLKRDWRLFLGLTTAEADGRYVPLPGDDDAQRLNDDFEIGASDQEYRNPCHEGTRQDVTASGVDSTALGLPSSRVDSDFGQVPSDRELDSVLSPRSVAGTPGLIELARLR